MGFNNVKTWTDYHEDDLRRDPIGTINRAFFLYTIHTERGVQAGKLISLNDYDLHEYPHNYIYSYGKLETISRKSRRLSGAMQIGSVVNCGNHCV